ncbi:MAG: class I SAM-dependent methyltransferase [Bacillota bacterium]
MFHTLQKQLKKPSGLLGIIVAKMMERRNRKYYYKVIQEMEIRNGDKILEIGYGPGDGIELFARNYDCQITGIDFSELMYKKASERNKKYIDSGKVHLKYGDLLNADLGIEKFDKVVCLNVVYFWNDLNEAFKKIISLLNDGGMYFIYMASAEQLTQLGADKEFARYSIDQVESALKQTGFNSIEYKNEGGFYIKARKH